ncbi:MAG: 50S ribosomal protein L11 methyltransferase [Xanthomonadales bacterium]|nr:50S ribosomal protein L11 methyltransferase [Xanthomonadales bacterium]
MPWLEISIRVTRDRASLVESLLRDQPVLALTLTDDADDPVFEPGVGETPLWPTTCVTALFEAGTPVEPLSRLLSLVPGIDRPQQVNFRTLDDRQWERLWLDRFQPMQFGRDLWVVPGDQAVPEQALHVLRLDPGLAFGTGTHPTTRLCLQWMDGHDFMAQNVLDYGCGSGVLGIVAAIKGANRVLCIDNDPQALTATRDNAQRNEVTNIIETLQPEEYTSSDVDVVLANILAAPLIELAPVLMARLKPGGYLVLSGILEQQADEVMMVYRPHMVDLSVTTDDGWVRIDGRKMT